MTNPTHSDLLTATRGAHAALHYFGTCVARQGLVQVAGIEVRVPLALADPQTDTPLVGLSAAWDGLCFFATHVVTSKQTISSTDAPRPAPAPPNRSDAAPTVAQAPQTPPERAPVAPPAQTSAHSSSVPPFLRRAGGASPQAPRPSGAATPVSPPPPPPQAAPARAAGTFNPNDSLDDIPF